MLVVDRRVVSSMHACMYDVFCALLWAGNII